MFWDRNQGILEAVFLTPMSSLAYMTGRMLSAFSLATMDLLFLFGLGYFLGFRVASFNVPLFLVTVLLMVVSLFGLGLIVNSVTLIFRDRVNTANTLTSLVLVFTGIVAPLRLMPSWAQVIGSGIPFTYALNLMRSSLLSSAPSINYGDLSLLVLLSLVYLLLGYSLLRATVGAVRDKALYSAF